MRKPILTITVISLIVVLIMTTGCNSSSKKIENAKENVQNANENVIDANQELNQALNDSIQTFRKIAEDQIIANEKSLALYKARIAKENKKNKAVYEKEWAKLVEKNKELKSRLNDYKQESNGNWEDFKTEYNRDMDELGKAFKNLTVKNVE